MKNPKVKTLEVKPQGKHSVSPNDFKVSPELKLTEFPSTNKTVSTFADSNNKSKKHSKAYSNFRISLSPTVKGANIDGEFENPLTEEMMKGLYDFVNTKSRFAQIKQTKKQKSSKI